MTRKLSDTDINSLTAAIRRGGADKYHEKNARMNKMFCRDRIRLLCDENSFVEDGLLANCMDESLPADGVVTGTGRIFNRPVALMASDSTVKAGSWGKRSVEKILRIQEKAAKSRIPIFYLVDSAGARITDQVEMFPGRRGAGRIFYNQAHLSGLVPQICILFGPSAAGGAYMPAFCDAVFMVDGNASMYLGSPRMAEIAIGEKTDLEKLGGARMHTAVSGCADFLCGNEREAIATALQYFSFFPQNCHEKTSIRISRPPAGKNCLSDIIPADQAKPFDVKKAIDCLVDDSSFVEVKERYAPEIVVGFARINGISIGIVANQPMCRGGVLFVNSADKAARFIRLCDAFNIPLLFLADVPGFMVGTRAEGEGIIRAGAKMISAVSEATVPGISVVLRKAYGAGLYAMCGPAFDPDAVIALPSANIAVMSPDAAVNAVYYNTMQTLPEDEREEFREKKRREYAEDVDLLKLASEMIVDAIVEPEDLRRELSSRFENLVCATDSGGQRKHGIHPM